MSKNESGIESSRHFNQLDSTPKNEITWVSLLFLNKYFMVTILSIIVLQ